MSMSLNFRFLRTVLLWVTVLIHAFATFGLSHDSRDKRQSVQTPKCGNRLGIRITNGEEAIPHSWPWMVSILKNDVHICGGSLVGRKKVITAAHCFNYIKKDDLFTVRLGLHSQNEPLSEGQQEIDVARFDVHSGYNRTTKLNDIAMVTLQRPVNYSEIISPICMGIKSQLSTDSTCFVTGWGKTKDNVDVSDTLQQLKLPVIDDNSICVNITRNINVSIVFNNSKQFCAGYLEGGKDSCQGDSGGPVVCKDPDDDDQWRLHGIVSFGAVCSKTAAIYTRVSAFRRWIADHAEK